jgi:aryl-alcohol dehydrogenase-like predicted oxidoreductase
VSLCLVQAGKVLHVGVSNFTPGQVERAHRFLAKHNIPLVSNQIEYSLLRRAPETNGVIDMCNKLHIKIIAYASHRFFDAPRTPSAIPILSNASTSFFAFRFILVWLQFKPLKNLMFF